VGGSEPYRYIWLHSVDGYHPEPNWPSSHEFSPEEMKSADFSAGRCGSCSLLNHMTAKAIDKEPHKSWMMVLARPFYRHSLLGADDAGQLI
jgi:hypothetical protein